MKKSIPALALFSFFAAVSVPPSSASAVPKMDVKVAVGVGSTTLVPRVPEIDLYDPETGDFISTVGGAPLAVVKQYIEQQKAR